MVPLSKPNHWLTLYLSHVLFVEHITRDMEKRIAINNQSKQEDREWTLGARSALVHDTARGLTDEHYLHLFIITSYTGLVYVLFTCTPCHHC